MSNVNDLRDLLIFDLKHLRSAEEQIEDVLPAMIAKATNPELKDALKEHYDVTRQHHQRVTELVNRLGEDTDKEGLLSILFNSSSVNKGIEGLINEGRKLMDVDMAPEVMDAAIIEAAQKIEHYEIAAYGTVRTFAVQLGMMPVAEVLQDLLDEEYEANDLLTELAVGGINREAEVGGK